MGQKFFASPAHSRVFKNGAIGFGAGGPMDCLGPYARVKQCPVMVGGAHVATLTCYATGYADTFFSIPACTRYRGKHVRGYFAVDGDGGVEFRVMNSHKYLFE